MSDRSLNLTIYAEKAVLPIDLTIIKKLIYEQLSSAIEIRTTLEKNDIDVMLNQWNNELILEKARLEHIKKFFEKDVVYNAIKSIDFLFENNENKNNIGQISFRLFPIYREKIEYDEVQDTKLDDFEILGYLNYYDGIYGSIDERFFELGENIIRILPKDLTKNNYLISFEGLEDETEIMNITSFLKKISNLKNLYCNNPNFGK